MRKYRASDILNPTAFFLLFGFLFLLFIPVLDIILNALFEMEIIFFQYRVESVLLVFLYLFCFAFSAYVISPIIFFYKPTHRLTPPIENLGRNRVFIYMKFVYTLAIIFFLLYFIHVGSIPALNENAAIFRVEAKKGWGGAVLLANAGFFVFAIVMGSYYGFLTRSKKILLFAFIFIAVIFSGATGFRGPAAYIFLGFVLTIFFFGEDFRIRRKLPIKMILLGILLLLLLSVIDYLRHGNNFDVKSIFQIIWTLTVNFYNFDLIFNAFDANGNYYYGSTFFTDLAVALPGIEGRFLGVDLVDKLGLSFQGEGMTVTSPGEGFVNFGYVGLVLHAFLLGLLSELTYQIMKVKNTRSSMIFLSFFSLTFPKTVASGIMPTFIFSFVPAMIFLVPLFFLCRR